LKGLAAVLAKISIRRIGLPAERAGFHTERWQLSGFSPAKTWTRQPGYHVLSDLFAVH
jgi:hypothetical protein